MNAPRIFVLGATSAIAQAYARKRAPEGVAFVLIARREDRLATVADDLRARGAVSADCYMADLAEIGNIERTVDDLASRFGPADEVVLSYGVLGEQAVLERDIAAARTALETNFTSAALWTLALLKDRSETTPLTLIAIVSVAADRGRASNFVYGSAKAGLDRFLEGLQQKYAGSLVRIVRVKPGLVDTPMTVGMAKGGPLWATPDRIADDIHRAVQRGQRVVYTPWFWWPVMMIIRHLPWFIFKRLKI